MPYVFAMTIGGLVGAGEMVSRYRDRPVALLGVGGAWTYVVLNAVVASGALLLIRSFGLGFGAPNESTAEMLQVLVAGFGSLAFFRSSFFTVRIGDQDVGVGPYLLLSTLLGVADRSVDRIRAQERSLRVTRYMANVSFEKSRVALPAFCLALLQNVSAAEQHDLATAVEALAASAMTDTQKSYALGLLLMNVAGPGVVASAVTALGDEISSNVGGGAAPAPTAARTVTA